MECVNCDCTVKTMDNLEKAIRALLQRGKHVNRMMDNEKLIRDARKMEEVEQLKKQMTGAPVQVVPVEKQVTPEEVTTEPTMPISNPQRRIFNKKWRVAESIDFDIPSLAYESSEILNDISASFTTASLSIPKKTCSSSRYSRSEMTVVSEQVTSTITTPLSQRASIIRGQGKYGGGSIVLHDRYAVDKNGKLQMLPMKVYIKQRLEDGSLQFHFVFFEENCKKVMDISMSIRGKKVYDVQFCGEDIKMVG